MSSPPGGDLEGEKKPKESILGWAPETRIPAQGTYEELLPGETGTEEVKQDWRARN